jgi:hypothetical protein
MKKDEGPKVVVQRGKTWSQLYCQKQSPSNVVGLPQIVWYYRLSGGVWLIKPSDLYATVAGCWVIVFCMAVFQSSADPFFGHNSYLYFEIILHGCDLPQHFRWHSHRVDNYNLFYDSQE